MNVKIITGDLLDQPCVAIVNPWNRNIIPWWLLLPHGVSEAIKRKAGLQPFVELGKYGPIPLGKAVATSAGNLPYKVIIHVAGINGLWRASKISIQDSVRSAIELAHKLEIVSIAFPIIGSGAGGFPISDAEDIMLAAFSQISNPLEVTLVRYADRPGDKSSSEMP